MQTDSNGAHNSTHHDQHQVIKGKNVLLISPQPWDTIRVSKHHYAIELCKHAATVTFLNPPRPNTKRFQLTNIEDGLATLDHSPWFPQAIRFHARWLFDCLMRMHVRDMLRHIPRPDIVWSFDCNLYSDLKTFGAPLRILHAVDPVPFASQIRIAESADYVISVSSRILNRFAGIVAPGRCHLINHGLHESFISNSALPGNRDTVRFGYCGNLLRRQIDHTAIRTIVERHNGIRFHFWGPFEHSEHIPGVSDFIDFLQSAPNCQLHGRVSTQTLAEQIQEMDGFLLAYNSDDHETDNSNSHKILEYLSTGSVVVSKPIEFYTETGLIEAASDDSTAALVRKFDEIVASLNTCNSQEQREKRLLFAHENTYARQLERILTIVSEFCPLQTDQ